MQKRWNILTADDTAVDALQQSLKINRTLCKILVQRGIGTFDDAKKFFRPQLSDLHDAWLMKDMLQAVKRITAAIEDNEHILVFGDYDVDGTTSVAAMYQYLKNVYPNVQYYIPHRYKEGYGISQAGVQYAIENNFSLIISLDCGIKSYNLISYAKEKGIDFIVCDHHLPDDLLPPAAAVLNPKQKDCTYPYKELCGCGVGFKLMQALSEELGLPPSAHLQYIDLVATAIAADIVPITGENRILAYYGLQKINSNPCNGIKALLQLAGMQQTLHISNLVFIVAPRINAAGRMDDAKKAVQLFIEKDYEQALKYADMLHADNTYRKEADTSITEEALQIIQNDITLEQRKTTVVFRDHWHKGVVGIVASRLVENYYRPTVVLTKSGDIVAGSARSVNGFNLYEAIHACREHLLGYGGHFAAAGMTMLPENVAAFSNKFEEIVAATITEDLLVPEIAIDAEIQFTELTFPFYNILSQMEPYGPQNMRPVFIARNITESGYSKIIKDQHIRFVLKQQNSILTGIGFGMADKFYLLQNHIPIDIVFTVELNEWNGMKSVQLRMIDFAPAEKDLKSDV
ncbi:single-stranded-DNA-specific exonuclease RecJ [Ilyomonas limi]|uniref:Single-stranded-DNA-specific exonuclease RecJ n=1 Tax=Ilyomonas limi TaxID=2575867 RepID=A0A4U3L9I1_9BACT|nr:single-stranded-DNA-specific exonuclease RecJ [Ilyomonas limi]TKK71981.1 single-stranded-DNA-specific exonuclease RecJ [Ilyomonas limi]